MGCYPGKVKTRNKNISLDNSQLLDIFQVENNNLGVIQQPSQNLQNNLEIETDPQKSDLKYSKEINQLQHHSEIKPIIQAEQANNEEQQFHIEPQFQQNIEDNVAQNSQIIDKNQLNVQNQEQYEYLFNQEVKFSLDQQNNKIKIEINEIIDIIIEIVVTNNKVNDSVNKENNEKNYFNDNNSSLLESYKVIQTYQCYECGLKVQENFFMFPCTHTFHQECLDKKLGEKDKNKPYVCSCQK